MVHPASSSSTQNVAFVSENTSSTNDVSTAYGVSNPSGQNSQYEHASSYSLLANQSSCPQLDHEDLEQLDEFDLEEMDLKWQVAMISMRMKKFYKKIGHFARECRTKGNQDSRRRDAWNSGNKDGRRSGKQEDSKALVTIDGEGVDWTSHSEEEEDYALMAFAAVQAQTQREQLGDASIEIHAYTQAVKKVEAQLVAHQQSQLLSQASESETQIDFDTCDSNCSDETHESLPEPAVNEPKVVSQPKVWSDAPIIEEYESDSEDEHVGTLMVARFAFGGRSKGYIKYSVKICDKKNKFLFTDSECLVLSPEFKLPDANQVLLRIPRQNNMYSFNLENIVPSGGLACLIAKATIVCTVNFLTKPTISPQHIDEFNLKDETSLSECDEEELNILNFNDLFPFNVIYPNDSKSDKDNDDDKVDIEQSLGDLSVKPLPDVINVDVGRYPVFIFSIVYTVYSLNEYNVFDNRNQYGVSWGMDTAYQLPVQFWVFISSLINEYMEKEIALVFLCFIQDLVKEISTNIGGEFKKSRDL
ncbi:hypothetical protein Tco_0649938 [Tanacetum coccineum]